MSGDVSSIPGENPTLDEREAAMDWRDWNGCTLSISGEAVEEGTPHLIIESGEPPPTVPVEVVPKSTCEAAEGKYDRLIADYLRMVEDRDNERSKCIQLRREVGRLREALSFYADDRRYDVDEDAVLNSWAGVDQSVLDEGGELARSALSPREDA